MSRRSKRGAPVVITRKSKRLFRTGHLAAFALTGGMSAVYTAAKATTNAGYNARTCALAEQSEQPGDDVRCPVCGTADWNNLSNGRAICANAHSWAI